MAGKSSGKGAILCRCLPGLDHKILRSGLFSRSAAFPVRSGGLSGEEIPQQLDRICAKRLCNGNKLDHVEAAFATFVLGDEGLRYIEAFGEGVLADSGPFPRSHEKADQTLIVFGFEGLLHVPPRP